MKKLLITLAFLALSACAQDGDRGPAGPTGSPGVPGNDGTDGLVVVGEYLLTETCVSVDSGLFAKRIGENKIRLASDNLCLNKITDLQSSQPTALLGNLLFVQDAVERDVLVVLQLN